MNVFGSSSAKPPQPSSSSKSTGKTVPIQARQVNESLFELYRPPGTPQLQVLFFHGLQFENSPDIHLSTWECGDGSCWPQTWLVEKFPDARVLCVSYDGSVTKNAQGVLDMYRVGENLISDLMQEDLGRIDCPIVLVGHSFGGLVIKQLCIQAHRDLHESKEGFRNAKLQTCLDNIRGIFYYATPHHGSKHVETMTKTEANPLLTYFGILSADTERLNSGFDKICKRYGNWSTFGLAEGRKTKWGGFKEDIMVPEASTRVGKLYTVSGADHFSICKPENKLSASFSKLESFLADIVRDAEVEAKKCKEAKACDYNRVDNLQILPEHAVGIEVPMQAIISKLDKAVTVGIVGMGGLGKTTLAKALFNKLAPQFGRFEYSCFVSEVKNIAGTIEQVKKEVWESMHLQGKKVGQEESWSSMAGKQMLLVLDDISNDRHLTLLSNVLKETSPGSRVIVTSRDHQLLARLDDVYDVSVLEETLATELFSSYAFGKQGPSLELKDIMGKIVKKCAGLPLALEVVAKSLYNRGYQKDWEETLHALVNASDVSDLNKKLWANLKVSYDRLSKTEQEIFLDVTTFFSGNGEWTLRDAKAAWRVVYNTQIEGRLWQTLVNLSLVYNVEENKIIQVHEQLQSLGRKLASTQRGVWDSTVGLELLQKTTTGDEQAIYSLRFSNKEDVHITSSSLPRLRELHYLNAPGPIIIDGAQGCDPIPTKLVLLSCNAPQLSHALVHSSLTKRMVGLKLTFPDEPDETLLFRYSRLRFHGLHEKNSGLADCILWSTTDMQFYPGARIHGFVHEIGKFSQLEVLELRNCRCSTLPEKFGQLLKLRHLFLDSFANLHTLPNSFGQLKALSYLWLWGCKKLRSLPDSFVELSSLNRVKLGGCEELGNLPESFGQLKALSYLDLWGCKKLRSLPDSFVELSSLNRLHLYCCEQLGNLPESFGQLKALSYLTLWRCKKLRSLPDSFVELSSLKYLWLDDCEELGNLPGSFGQLKALSYLGLRGCKKLRSLPDSFVELSSLNHLHLYCCEQLGNLPESFGQLKALSYLALGRLKKLRSLPDSFVELSSLNHLQLLDCEELGNLPESFGQLKALSYLILWGCKKLRSLPDSFMELSSLNHLELRDCEELGNLPESFGRLKALSYLRLCGLKKLCSLPDSFVGLSSLNHLKLEACEELGNLPESFGQLKALSRLRLGECKKLRSLPYSFGELPALKFLELAGCEQLHALPNGLNYLKFREVKRDEHYGPSFIASREELLRL